MNSVNSKILINQLTMNWDKFRDFLFLCLDDCVVTSLSITQEVVGSNNLFTKKLSLNPMNVVIIFRENSIETIIVLSQYLKSIFVHFNNS